MHVGLWPRCGVGGGGYEHLCKKGLGAIIWWKGQRDCDDGRSPRDSIINSIFTWNVSMCAKWQRSLKMLLSLLHKILFFMLIMVIFIIFIWGCLEVFMKIIGVGGLKQHPNCPFMLSQPRIKYTST